jgi:hypothetical protein
MSKDLTNDDLKALIPHDSRVYYCKSSRGICVVQTAEADVLAILSGGNVSAVARRARLIACIPMLLAGCDDDTLRDVLDIVSQEPSEDDPRRAWPPVEW